MLQGQAVVAEKARHGYRRGGQNAEPTCGFLADYRTKAQVDGHGDPHGNNDAEKLPGGQAEKDTFFVLADFFWDFDFDT